MITLAIRIILSKKSRKEYNMTLSMRPPIGSRINAIAINLPLMLITLFSDLIESIENEKPINNVIAMKMSVKAVFNNGIFTLAGSSLIMRKLTSVKRK
jgi:hypothetical protein